MSEKENKVSRNNKIDFRISDEELSDLSYMSFKTGKKRSDIIRDALKMYKNIIKNQ